MKLVRDKFNNNNNNNNNNSTNSNNRIIIKTQHETDLRRYIKMISRGCLKIGISKLSIP